jgi:phage-related protein
MNTETALQIVIRAKNEASRVINEVKGDISKAVSKIGAGLSSTVGPSTAMLGALTAATAGAVAFGVKSVQAYNDSVQASTKLRTNLLNVKGATMEQVDSLETLASKLQSVGVIEDDVIKAGMSQLATFNLQSSTIASLTPKITDMVAQLKGHNATAEDMVGINNLVGKVMTGNVGALARYGVTLNDNQKEMLAQGTEAQKAAVLNEVLAQNYGKVNEALRNTPQGAVTALKNSFGDLQEGVGQFLSQALSPVVQKLGDWLKVVDAAGGPMEYLKGVFERNKTAIYAIAGAITAGLIPAVVSLGAKLLTTFGLTNPWFLAILAIGAIIGVIIQKTIGFKGAIEKLKGAFDAIGRVVSTFIMGIKALVAAFNDPDVTSNGFVGAMEKVGSTLRKVWDTAKPVVSFIGGQLKSAFTTLWEAIQKNLLPALQRLMPVIKVIGAILGGLIVANIVIAFGALVAVIWLVINALKIVINVFSWIVQAGANVVSGIIAGFTMMWQVLTTIWNAVWAVVSTVFGIITTIITTYINIWKAIFQGIGAFISYIWQWVLAIATLVWNQIWQVISPIVNMIKGAWQSVSNAIAGMWQWLVGVAQGAWNGIANAVQGVWNRISGIWNGAISWLSGIWNRISSGFSNAFSGIGGAVSGAFNGVKGAVIGGINWIIDKINGFINKVNSVADKVPGAPHIGNIGRLAAGTSSWRGGLTMVGEQGRELVSLPKGAQVLNNSQTEEALGGTTNNFYGTINLNSAEAVDRFYERFNRDSELADMGVAI